MKALSQNLVKLVRLLSDGQYHDGTSIGAQLNITRAGVWKATRKLAEYGVPLTSIKGKGYRLESELLLLDENQLRSQLRHHRVTIKVLEKISSTNDYLKNFPVDDKQVIACFAESQTAARGRLQRQWYSPFADNIYLSLLCSFAKDVSELSGLSLVVVLAVCRAIECKLELPEGLLKVKWPNDILIDHGKLAGTLIEIQSEANGFCRIIIGIGINVNMKQVNKKTVNQAWASLTKITGQYIDRNILGSEIIDTVIDYLESFLWQGLAQFAQEWQKRDYLRDAQISVISGNNQVSGACLGIDSQGCLKLKTTAGKLLTLSSGDTTLLK